MFRAFERRPHERYRSDGNPETIAFPKGHATRLDFEALHADGKPLLCVINVAVSE